MFLSRKNPAAGFTLVEIMMVIAVVAIFYLGVLLVMNRVTYGTWSITKTSELTSQMRQAMTWIGEDFKNAKAASLGNLVKNYGFENPFDLNQTTLTGWTDVANSPVGPGQAVDRVVGGGPNIKGGFKSLALAAVDTTDYFSNIISIPDSGQYVVSSWVKANNTIASFSLVQGDKSNFVLPIIAQNNNNYYVHLTTAVLLNVGQTTRLKLSKPDATWNFDYDTTQQVVWDFCIFKGKLYAGTGQNGRIYVKDGSNPWALAATLGAFRVYSFCVYQNRLYAGTYNPARIYVTDDGITWNVSYNPPAGTVLSFNSLCEYKGRLFAGTYGSPMGTIARIFVFDGVNPWAEVMTLPETEIFHLCVYRDKLFAGTRNDDKIYAHEGNNPTANWNVAYDVVAVNNWAVKRFCVYKDVLYAGTYASGNIYYHTGDVPTANWNIAYTIPGGLPNSFIMSLGVYKDKLYMGTESAGWIYKHWGDIPTINWNIDFDSPESDIESLGVYEDKLYAGGLSMGRIYVLGGAGYFDDVAISPSVVVFDNTTLIDGTHNVYKYDTSKGNDGSVYYDRLKLYRLRYVTVAAPDPAAPGKLFRERWVGPGANDYEIMSGEPLANNVKSLRITNNNQESFEVELVLEKVKGGKTQEYRIKNTYTPLVK